VRGKNGGQVPGRGRCFSAGRGGAFTMEEISSWLGKKVEGKPVLISERVRAKWFEPREKQRYI